MSITYGKDTRMTTALVLGVDIGPAGRAVGIAAFHDDRIVTANAVDTPREAVVGINLLFAKYRRRDDLGIRPTLAVERITRRHHVSYETEKELMVRSVVALAARFDARILYVGSAEARMRIGDATLRAAAWGATDGPETLAARIALVGVAHHHPQVFDVLAARVGAP